LLITQCEFAEHFAGEVDERRRMPRDDMISDLVTATIEGEPLSDSEILAMLSQFLVAGNETTTKLLAGAVRILIESPQLTAELRSHPEAVGPFIEEVLRLETPVQGLYRTATEDTSVGGVLIAKGEHLLLMYAAGNRDQARFAEPQCLRLQRDGGSSHLSFGHGEHLCLGAALARAEGRIGIAVLLDRLEDLRAADGVDMDRLEYESSYILHGLRRLDVQFRARDRFGG
jgi:cytochrome P450